MNTQLIISLSIVVFGVACIICYILLDRAKSKKIQFILMLATIVLFILMICGVNMFLNTLSDNTAATVDTASTHNEAEIVENDGKRYILYENKAYEIID